MSAGASSRLRALRGPLLRWYRRNRRDLPWRRTRDPYAVWVSEVMLQQTRVAVVIPYYERFLARFPSVAALARASEEDVLSLWSGLGYYGRARSLRAGAREVVERHAGSVPDDPEALRRLPGIGRYTAGAISSLAFGREEPVLEGNVRRVLSRLLALEAPEEETLWDLALGLVRGRAPGDLNQALMELGALVCAPGEPRCGACPVARHCAGLAAGSPERFPAPRSRRKRESVRVAVALVERGDHVLLERPRDGNPLRGTWELPAVEIAPDADPRAALEVALSRRHRLSVRALAERGRASHSILHRRLHLEILSCRLVRGSVRGTPALRWLDPKDLDATPVSGATMKVLGSIQRLAGTAPRRSWISSSVRTP